MGSSMALKMNRSNAKKGFLGGCLILWEGITKRLVPRRKIVPCLIHRQVLIPLPGHKHDIILRRWWQIPSTPRHFFSELVLLSTTFSLPLLLRTHSSLCAAIIVRFATSTCNPEQCDETSGPQSPQRSLLHQLPLTISKMNITIYYHFVSCIIMYHHHFPVRITISLGFPSQLFVHGWMDGWLKEHILYVSHSIIISPIIPRTLYSSLYYCTIV